MKFSENDTFDKFFLWVKFSGLAVLSHNERGLDEGFRLFEDSTLKYWACKRMKGQAFGPSVSYLIINSKNEVIM